MDNRRLIAIMHEMCPGCGSQCPYPRLLIAKAGLFCSGCVQDRPFLGIEECLLKLSYLPGLQALDIQGMRNLLSQRIKEAVATLQQYMKDVSSQLTLFFDEIEDMHTELSIRLQSTSSKIKGLIDLRQRVDSIARGEFGKGKEWCKKIYQTLAKPQDKPHSHQASVLYVKRELGKLERFVQAVAASTRVGFKSPRAQVQKCSEGRLQISRGYPISSILVGSNEEWVVSDGRGVLSKVSPRLQLKGQAKLHSAAIRSAVIDSSGLVLTGGEDYFLSIVDSDLKLVHQFPKDISIHRLLLLLDHESGCLLATSRGLKDSYRIKVWDYQARQPLGSLEGHTDNIGALALVQDGQHLISCSDDQTIRLWSFRTMTCQFVKARSQKVSAILFNQQLQLTVAAEGLDFSLFQGLQFQLVRVFRQFPNLKVATIFSLQSQFLVCFQEEHVRLYKWSNCQLVRRFSLRMSVSSALQLKEGLVLLGDRHGTLHLVNKQTA